MSRLPRAGLREMARVGRRHLVVPVPQEPVFRGCNLLAGRYLRALGTRPGHLNHWSRRGFVRSVAGVAEVREVSSPFPWTAVWATLPDHDRANRGDDDPARPQHRVAGRLSHVPPSRWRTELRSFCELFALTGGLIATAVYARSSGVRLWLRYATPAPLVFALLFVTVSPAGKLVLPGGQETGRARAVVPADARAPVVMVFFDEFPMMSLLDSRGRIDRRLYPHFASFAQDATWYRNATGVSPFTPYAVPAMLTGRYPAKSLAPSYTEYPDNLFTLLADSYQVRAWETVTQLCPPRVCTASAEANGGTGWQALARDSARVWEQIVSPRRSSDDNPAAQSPRPRCVSVGRRPASRRAGAGPPSGSTSSRPTSPPALPISWSS